MAGYVFDPRTGQYVDNSLMGPASRATTGMGQKIREWLTPKEGWEYGSVLPFKTKTTSSSPTYQDAEGRSIHGMPVEQKQYGLAAPGMFREAAGDALNLFEMPYLAATGKIDPLDPANVESIARGAATVGAGGMIANKAPEGALRSFGGGADKGIKAYHGSPHSFDNFSMDAIGTGEGAQAYGHGLYFAESEGVARSYRDALTQQNAGAAQRGLAQQGGDIAAAIAEARRKVDLYAEMAKQPDAPDMAKKLLQINKQKLADLEAGATPSGSMYEVNINANPDDFLDWDKPLSEQPAAVKEVLGPRVDALRQAGAGMPQDPNGETLWRAAHPQGGFDRMDFSRSVPEQAAERFREAGIPGIRYADQGSRGAEGGTSNFVVFDDKLISIVRKYGIAGAAAMLGVSQSDLRAQAAEMSRTEKSKAEIRSYLDGLK